MPEFQTTLDRDIRFTPWQIAVTSTAMRSEIRKRTRSIEKAEAARTRGDRFQAGVLQEHYDARQAAREVLEALEVARKQIAHRIAQQVNTA